jgi:hypothetical protein
MAVSSEHNIGEQVVGMQTWSVGDEPGQLGLWALSVGMHTVVSKVAMCTLHTTYNI